MAQVVIRNEQTGAEYEIAEEDLDAPDMYRDPASGDMKSYKDAGFTIVRNADNSPREGEEAVTGTPDVPPEPAPEQPPESA